MKAKDLVRYILTDEQLKTNVVLADNSAGELGFTPFNDICEVIAEAEKDTTKDVLVVLASDENLADLESIFEKLSHLPNVYIFAVDYKGTQINNVFNPAIPEMHFCENDIAMNIDNTSFVVDM
jgi:ssRNA-specific RNase YbeY (16S rRNA maturation enzyme)